MSNEQRVRGTELFEKVVCESCKRNNTMGCHGDKLKCAVCEIAMKLISTAK